MNSFLSLNSNILAYALRYTLDRWTGARIDVFKAIGENWESMQHWEQVQIQKELTEHLERQEKYAQHEADHNQFLRDKQFWQEILDLTPKPFPSFPGNEQAH